MKWPDQLERASQRGMFFSFLLKNELSMGVVVSNEQFEIGQPLISYRLFSVRASMQFGNYLVFTSQIYTALSSWRWEE